MDSHEAAMQQAALRFGASRFLSLLAVCSQPRTGELHTLVDPMTTLRLQAALLHEKIRTEPDGDEGANVGRQCLL